MKKLNVYLSNLAVLNAKFHNLHWNVVGKEFVQIHQFTESAYDSFFEQYDEVAELLKMRGEYPLVKLEDFVKNATVKELAAKDFTVKEVLDIVEGDFKLMMDMSTEIRNEADKANDFVVVAKFEEYVAGYQKNLWFIKAIKA